MKKRLSVAITSSLACALLVAAPSAGAATEFGTGCTANRAEEGIPPTVIQLTQNGAPTAAPVSGVITQWKLNLVPEVPISIPQQLKVFRPTANPTQFQVVGESAVSNISGGPNTFPTRIPIQAGDRLGLFGPLSIGALWCEGPGVEAPGNSFGFVAGNPPVGATGTVVESFSEALAPPVGVIEADADGDGYGDETQDLCPQSATTQAACPVVVLDAFSIAGGKAVTVLVATSTAAPVTVTASAKLGKGAIAKLSSKPKAVTAGRIARFRLTFPGSLRKKLKDLKPGKRLTLKIVASATSVSGQVTKDRLKAKLKGKG